MDNSWDESSNKIQMIRGHMGFYGRYGQNKLSETSRRPLGNLSETSWKPLGTSRRPLGNLSETSRKPLGTSRRPLRLVPAIRGFSTLLVLSSYSTRTLRVLSSYSTLLSSYSIHYSPRTLHNVEYEESTRTRRV